MNKAQKREIKSVYKDKHENNGTIFLCLFASENLGISGRKNIEEYLRKERILPSDIDWGTVENLFLEDGRETQDSRDMADILRPMILDHFLNTL